MKLSRAGLWGRHSQGAILCWVGVSSAAQCGWESAGRGCPWGAWPGPSLCAPWVVVVPNLYLVLRTRSMSVRGCSRGTWKEYSEYTASTIAPLSYTKASPDLFFKTNISYVPMDQLTRGLKVNGTSMPLSRELRRHVIMATREGEVVTAGAWR